jgi:hypothetical protein
MTDSKNRVHRMQVFKEHSRRIAYAAGAKLGFDPVTITAIATMITQIFNLVTSCARRNVDPDPDTLSESIHAVCESPTKRRNMRNKLARRVAGSSDVPLTGEQAKVIADCWLDETLAAHPRRVAAIAQAVRQDEYDNAEAVPQDFVVDQYIDVDLMNREINQQPQAFTVAPKVYNPPAEAAPAAAESAVDVQPEGPTA